MKFEHDDSMEFLYATQLVLDAVQMTLQLPVNYRVPDPVSDYADKLLAAADSGEWDAEDAARLTEKVIAITDLLAGNLWMGLGLDSRGWEKPCDHPECIAHRDQVQAADQAGEDTLAEFLKELGIDLEGNTHE